MANNWYQARLHRDPTSLNPELLGLYNLSTEFPIASFSEEWVARRLQRFILARSALPVSREQKTAALRQRSRGSSSDSHFQFADVYLVCVYQISNIMSQLVFNSNFKDNLPVILGYFHSNLRLKSLAHAFSIHVLKFHASSSGFCPEQKDECFGRVVRLFMAFLDKQL